VQLPPTDHPGIDPGFGIFNDEARKWLQLGWIEKFSAQRELVHTFVLSWLQAVEYKTAAAQFTNLKPGSVEWRHHVCWWTRQRAVNHTAVFSTLWYQCMVCFCLHLAKGTTCSDPVVSTNHS